MVRHAERQSGQTLMLVVFITAIAALLVVASLSWAQSSAFESSNSTQNDIALEAAQAGVQLYISRLVENPEYWTSYVDTAEDPRINTSTGATVQPGAAWPSSANWTYAATPTTWTSLQNAQLGNAQYNLRIFPDASDKTSVFVESTGRVSQGTEAPVLRSVMALVSPESIADFQMISNASIAYGTGATTTGKIYSADDVVDEGTAEGTIFAAHYVCSTDSSGATCEQSQATSSAFSVGGAYDSTTTPSFADKFPTPISFTTFTSSISNIEAAAAASGTDDNSSSVNAWEVQFLSNGTARIYPITNTSDPGVALGKIGCPTTVTLPSGGAPYYMYFQQPVIIGDDANITDACGDTSGERDSVVNGQVTIADASNIYIGGNISYASGTNSVLGLVAEDNVIISQVAPYNLSWRAATLAQSGEWYTDTSNTTHGTMTFTGSIATDEGGYASMFATRNYNYDPTLQSLRPPLFPTIEDSWSVAYWHQVTPP